MKFPNLWNSILIGLSILVCLSVTACHKSYFVKRTSSDPVKQARIDWNLQTTVDAYEKAGHTSYKWDAPAIRALAEYSYCRADVLASNEPAVLIISTNVTAAMQSGCDDPLVNYLFIKYALDQTTNKDAYTEALCKVADEMQVSTYPEIRKFYASFRAETQFAFAHNYPQNTQPVMVKLCHRFRDSLEAVLVDKTTPPEEVYDVCHEVVEAWHESPGLESYYHTMEPPLFKNWTNEPVAWLLKGEAYIGMAWAARGTGYANTVTDEGQKLFEERLDTAEESLNHAWELNPKDSRIALQMMSVELGQGQGRERMELWFGRAMKLDPNDYDACSSKLHYLYPQWYGSRDDMIAFGRECVASTNWGGNVPLILSDAHREYWLYLNDSEEQSNYWKQPDVWPDIKASFERFFKLNPDAIGYYYNYTWYAYKCEQWDTLNELIPKLGPVNYDYFGGKSEYEKMVLLAKEHAGNSTATKQQ